jgi:hypothetical protein
MWRKLISLLVLMCFGMAGYSQAKEVTIRISQDESYVLNKYFTEITLKKKSFRIQVLLSGVSGIYSFAGFTDSVCCTLGELDTIPNFSLFPDITLAEADFNKEKELLVGEKDCSYWYFDPALNTHRFNKKVVMLDSNRYVGVKSIKQVLYVPTNKEIKIKDLDTPLYLFFVAVDQVDSKGRPVKELMRRKVRINWSEDD